MNSLSRAIAAFPDYALLDSGNGERLERVGEVVMIRPDPQALWAPSLPQEAWDAAALVYARDGREGDWEHRRPTPSAWEIAADQVRFIVHPTSFKHLGVFPEQQVNWQWIEKIITADMSVLNLFGYTGGATMAALTTGASVTHVDASKPVVTWAHENADLSGFADHPVRWIEDDARKFVAREVRRGNHYHAIFLDPPAFGRGPKGEVWKFAEDLPPLLADCAQLLTPEHGILLVNAYSLGFPALVIENLIRAAFPFPMNLESVELTLQETSPRGFLLPCGIAVRATW